MRQVGARRWRPRRLGRSLGAPAHLRPWLDEPGSLTQRLRGACGARFRVRVIGEGWGRPWRDEAVRLDVPLRRRVWVREVLLGCAESPWVHARTIVPESSLHGPLRRLRHLGGQPLGRVLFGRYPLSRGPIQVSRLAADDGLWGATAGLLGPPGVPLWARRSVFHVAGRALLVTEVFLPAMTRGVNSHAE